MCVGETFMSLSYLFRMGRTTISEVVMEVCKAIVSALQEDYMTVRATTCHNSVTKHGFHGTVGPMQHSVSVV